MQDLQNGSTHRSKARRAVALLEHGLGQLGAADITAR